MMREERLVGRSAAGAAMEVAKKRTAIHIPTAAMVIRIPTFD
jgi:hypothetical protein